MWSVFFFPTTKATDQINHQQNESVEQAPDKRGSFKEQMSVLLLQLRPTWEYHDAIS